MSDYNAPCLGDPYDWEKVAAKLDLEFIRSTTQKEIDGIYKKCRISMWDSGENHLTVSLPKSLSFKFRIKKQNVFAEVQKFFGMQDLEIGAQSFDNLFIIQGEHPLKIRRYLTKERRLGITRYFTRNHKFSGICIDNTQITLSCNLLLSAFELEEIIKNTVELALILSPRRKKRKSIPDKEMEPDAVSAPASASENIESNNESLGEDELVNEMNELDERILSLSTEILTDEIESLEEMEETAADDNDDDYWEGEIQDLEEQIDDLSSQDLDKEIAELNEEIQEGESVSSGTFEIEQKHFIDEIFSEDKSNFEVEKIFEEKFKDQKIQWTGVLRSVKNYYSELNLPSGPGNKAVIDLGKITNKYQITQMVQGVLKIEDKDVESMKEKIDTEIQFEATLFKIKPILRSIYMTGLIED